MKEIEKLSEGAAYTAVDLGTLSESEFAEWEEIVFLNAKTRRRKDTKYLSSCRSGFATLRLRFYL